MMRRWLQLLMVLTVQILVCFGFGACRPPLSIRQQSALYTTGRRLSILFEHKDSSQQAVAIKHCKSVHDVLTNMQEAGPIVNAAALRRLADLLTSRRVSAEDRSLAHEKIIILLKELDLTVNDVSSDLNLHALSDILTALAKIEHVDNSMSLANRVCRLMDESDDDLVHTLTPYRLVECLQSLAALELDHSSLISRICHRLQQGDALAKLQARHLAVGFKALVLLIEQTDDNILTAMRAFLRRWRKQAVRQTATNRDICQTLYAARRCLQQTANDDSLNDEMITMVYTLLREVHSPSSNTTASRSLTAGQVAEVIMTASAFQVNTTNPIYQHLTETLKEDRTMKRATVPDVSRILLTMERLGLSIYPLVVQRLGRRFLDLVQEECVAPKSTMNILRSALGLHQRNDEVMDPFIKATRFIVMERTKDDGPSFLEDCSDVELSSLVRFLSLVRSNDEAVLVTLAERILKPDIVGSCSPTAASRILTYFTSLIDTSTEEMVEMRSLLSEMFHELGTHLLSAQLTPAETSAAMQAYAKASYVQDMGIFDHLAGHLRTMLDDCTVRQVVQALWSCGKMVAWESDHGEGDKSGPPYLKSTKDYTAFLASQAMQLNAKDISQVLWALGWLGIDDMNIVRVFADRSSQVASDCNSQEVANILWGLSKVGYGDCEVVSVLTKRMLELRPSPQESATVLYALGRMEIRDEYVFSSMSDIMMEQLESASAQAIANALWAYQTVQIPPPRELMDSWVIQKLGLDGVQINRIEDL